MQKKYLIYFFLAAALPSVQAQQADSLAQRTLDEMVITATRTEKMLSVVPVPVTVISQEQMKAMGSLRLNEVLIEQTGLAIVNNHGQGIQIQGFNPEYTLILIDGEPLIGRTAGTLELSRIAVANIRQIEIVKGPSSSLYGSEALAGVINIITDTPRKNNLSLSARYGANHTADFSLNGGIRKEKYDVSLFLNRYSSQGYDLTPATIGNTVEPFSTYTAQARVNYRFSKKLRLELAGRMFTEEQQMRANVGSSGEPDIISGSGRVLDHNLNPVLHWQPSDKLRVQTRFYRSGYQTKSSTRYEKDQTLFEENFFDQFFTRPEIQADYFLSDKHVITAGSGLIAESVEATRYTSKQHFQTYYGFVQHEWNPLKSLSIVSGARFDAHSVYGSQLSPKLSARYQISERWALRASAGRGFKAPDFRQLYLSFTNAVAGYYVFGSEEVSQAIARMTQQGLIADVFVPLDGNSRLGAERSTAVNIGISANPVAKLNWNLNMFRNDVSDLIESQVFARTTNGQNIFSYRNLRSIYTQGLETDLSYTLGKYLNISAGYQYLIAHDKDVLERIDAGLLFRRPPGSLQTVRVSRADYGGLFGRSRHMANFKIFYDNKEKGFNASLRMIWRGRYGFGDMNGNLILDSDEEYVASHQIVNFSTAKLFLKEKLRLQAGIDNLLNFTNPNQIPNMPGRLWYTSISYQLY